MYVSVTENQFPLNINNGVGRKKKSKAIPVTDVGGL
jgi:hypothetical protein